MQTGTAQLELISLPPCCIVFVISVLSIVYYNLYILANKHALQNFVAENIILEYRNRKP